MPQRQIGDKTPEAGKSGEIKTKKIDTPEALKIFLGGFGFEEHEDKPNLYKKKNTEENYTMFWDFRNTPKGNFYVSVNGGGMWKDDDAKQLGDYIEIRKVLGGDEKKKGSTAQPIAPSIKTKETEEIVLTQEQYMRGTEEKISRLIDTKLQLDSI